ncbi:MAG: SDR family oxidoreductase [Actinomycetia bacterium]|nr:SDR family oxidoreductase [Actinomycetes bacterium]
MSTAFVTGAGGGLGRAIAIRLAGDGHPVAVVDIDGSEAERTCGLITEAKGTSRPYVIDLRHEATIETAMAEAEATLGPVHILVNNAAIFPAGPFLDVTPEEYDDAITINQRAYFFAAQAAVRLMRSANRGGAIVNIGSITQHGGWAEMVPYATTKGAAATFTRALATELGPHEIRVNCVAPGAFPTRAEEMHPDPEAYSQRIIESQALKRRGKLSDIAAAVSFLVGPESSFITGQTLNVDGGWIMA